MNDVFIKAGRWLVLPMPAEVPEWSLTSKDDGITEGKNFRQPVSRDSLQLAPLSLGRGEKQ